MSNDCKIFVGNVPFKCDLKKFNNCFKHINGFIKAELCSQNNDDSSRGFAFLIFDSAKNAQKMLNTNINFMDRELRFHQYNFENVKKISDNLSSMTLYNNILSNKNYIHISNLHSSITRDDLKKMFSKYGKIGKYFLMTDHKTGISKNAGIIEIIDNEVFELLLNKKIIKYGDNIFELSKWKLEKPIKITTKKRTNTQISTKNG
jgi:RNA recognition motif-containing protein